VPHECPLKRVRQDLDILLVQFVVQSVLDAASKPSREPASKSCLLRACLRSMGQVRRGYSTSYMSSTLRCGN
jgi:hypothetical protein